MQGIIGALFRPGLPYPAHKRNRTLSRALGHETFSCALKWNHGQEHPSCPGATLQPDCAWTSSHPSVWSPVQPSHQIQAGLWCLRITKHMVPPLLVVGVVTMLTAALTYQRSVAHYTATRHSPTCSQA
jgi:hypothetical protein